MEAGATKIGFGRVKEQYSRLLTEEGSPRAVRVAAVAGRVLRVGGGVGVLAADNTRHAATACSTERERTPSDWDSSGGAA